MATISRQSTLDSFLTLTARDSTRRTGTRKLTNTATSAASQDIICALSESRGVSSTVGIAFVNLATAEVVLCQICDSQTFVKTVTKIGIFEPSEILFMRTAQETKLRYIIEENLPTPVLTFADRRSWSDRSGLEYLDRLGFPDEVNSLRVILERNYFAACSFAAALKYIEVELEKVFAAHSLRIRFEPSEGSMIVGLSTIVSLELIQNSRTTKSKDSLYGLLNATTTPMGGRLLRANILQPSTDRVKLTARYNAVEDLSSKEDMFVSVRQALKGFVDADRVLTSIILVPTRRTAQYIEQSVNYVIMLKTFVSAISKIYVALGPAQSEILTTIRELCHPAGHRNVEELIAKTLNENITYQSKPLDLRNQRIYCVKAGVSSLLDVARQIYKEANADAAELVTSLAENLDLRLDLKYDTARQYYICLPAGRVESLPDVFINVYRKKNRIECQTLDLVKLNQKIADAHSEVINMSDQTIQTLLVDVCADVASLFRTSEAIAMLDMLAAFAQIATSYDYVRPELTATLTLKAGRHPIRERIHSSSFVPNDACATPQTRFQIVTGCNMSGKSTYIRSIALMTVMAHVGCFVPAQFASFPITHQLFARFATSDDLDANVSTFAAEMREMAFILRHIQPGAMVFIDELGRGTSTTDGLAIAIAISEALLASNSWVWFATHFHDLARILSERSGVINLHLVADITPYANKMTMLYQIAEGPVPDRRYGLQLAKLVDLPPKVLETAGRISQSMDRLTERRSSSSRADILARKRKLLLGLREELILAHNGSMDNVSLRKHLVDLQQRFVLNLASLEKEAESQTEGMCEPRETISTRENTLGTSRRAEVHSEIEIDDCRPTSRTAADSDSLLLDSDHSDSQGPGSTRIS
ncbi:Uncharacterized protein PECH_000215 [Penicillium ucsense]|uniref:DNA mismatch repair proteins mutS family domain-containing protein n=1 Tax=Penicillium ucsense TaxID=2839758 RepID=A0A8J8W9P8_9EURO|nr:Uncharacterized protein PECM_008542 [Penicillium ucsense]KAF7738496.1 Uncharacterized protein PECH_000215 [Penicillium ucsense]